MGWVLRINPVDGEETAAALLGLAACAQPAPTVAPPVVDPYASTGGGAVFRLLL